MPRPHPSHALIAAILAGVAAWAAELSAQGPTLRTSRETMQKDAKAARKTFGRFRELLAARNGDDFLVKKLCVEGEGKRRREELLWIRVTGVTKVESKDASPTWQVRGKVANRPAVLPLLKLADKVCFDAGELQDWLVTKGGRSFAGGYSLRDPEPFRTMRWESDRAGLPAFVLHDFALEGVVAKGPLDAKKLADLRRRAWNRTWVELRRNGLDGRALDERKKLWHARFDAVVLPVRDVVLLLSREPDRSDPKAKAESTTVRIRSVRAGGYTRGELFLAVQAAATRWVGTTHPARFGMVAFVRMGEKGVPTYVVQIER